MEGLGSDAEIATRLRFIRRIKIIHMLFFKRELYRSMYFELNILFRLTIEVSESILAFSR